MVSIDLYRNWPSIRRRTTAPEPQRPAGLPKRDVQRSTTLDNSLGARKARKADPARVRDLLSQLIQSIEGKPLSAFVPMAEAVPLLLGLSPQNLAAFDEFLGSFIGTVVGDLGRVVTPGSVTSPADSISANRRRLSSGALGVRRTEVQPGRPASRRKFDELMVLLSEGKTLAAVLGDGDDGLPPGTAEIVNGMSVAIRNNLRAGSDEGARQAGADAGALIAAIHGAFFTEATAGQASRTRGGRVARSNTAGHNGPVLVRKMPLSSDLTSRAIVKEAEFLDTGKKVLIDPSTGKPARRRTGKPARARKG